MKLGHVGRSWSALAKTVAEVYANRLLSPLPILAIALAIVITGVLAFRLHAFLTLIVAALAVAALTPVASIERYELTRDGVRIERVSADGRAHVTARRGQLAAGASYDLFSLGTGRQRPHRIGTVQVDPAAAVQMASGPIVVDTPLLVRLAEPGVLPHAGDWVTTATIARGASRIAS
jgi:hypothetical protein